MPVAGTAGSAAAGVGETHIESMRAGRYLGYVLACVLAALALMFIVNLVVDPIASRPAATRSFPLHQTFEREIRWNMISHQHPDVVFLGASQVAIGIDASRPVVGGAPAFNAGIDGGSLQEGVRLLSHAFDVGKVSSVYLGVSYNSLHHGEQDGFNSAFLASPGPAGTLAMVRARLSGAMFLSSLRGIWARLRGAAPLIDEHGRTTEALLKKEVRGYGGYHQAFYENAKSIRGIFAAPADPEFGNQIRRGIALSCSNHARFTIVSVPVHAYDLEVISITGHWQDYKNWLSGLVAIAQASPCPVSVVDFSGYNAVTTEPVPPNGQKTAMRYYWDIAHFSVLAGNLLEDRLFGKGGTASAGADSFGVSLSSDTLTAHFDQLEADRARYEASHAVDIAALRRALRE